MAGEAKALVEELTATLSQYQQRIAATQAALAVPTLSAADKQALQQACQQLQEARTITESSILELRKATLLHSVHSDDVLEATETQLEDLPAGPIPPEPQSRFPVGTHCQLLERTLSGGGQWLDVEVVAVGKDMVQAVRGDATVTTAAMAACAPAVDSGDRLVFLVQFCRPTQESMKTCPFFSDRGKRCHFGSRCKLSHGVETTAGGLRAIDRCRQSGTHQVRFQPGDSVLALYRPESLWYTSRVEAANVVEAHGSKETCYLVTYSGYDEEEVLDDHEVTYMPEQVHMIEDGMEGSEPQQQHDGATIETANSAAEYVRGIFAADPSGDETATGNSQPAEQLQSKPGPDVRSLFPISSGREHKENSDEEDEEEDEAVLVWDHLLRNAWKSTDSTSESTDPQELGAWQQFTTGVGLKLLKKFGYEEGKGLGAQGQGRAHPVLPDFIPQVGNVALDFIHKPELTSNKRRGKGKGKRKRKREMMEAYEAQVRAQLGTAATEGWGGWGDPELEASAREHGTDMFALANTLMVTKRRKESEDTDSKTGASLARSRAAFGSSEAKAQRGMHVKDVRQKLLAVREELRKVEADCEKFADQARRFKGKGRVGSVFQAQHQQSQARLNDLKREQRRLEGAIDKKKTTRFKF